MENLRNYTTYYIFEFIDDLIEKLMNKLEIL